MTRLLSPSRCRALGACLATALLAGCGGGHDDDRFDVRAGLRNLMTQPRALTLTGSSGTVSYTLTLTNTPQQAGTYVIDVTFNGELVHGPAFLFYGSGNFAEFTVPEGRSVAVATVALMWNG